MHKIVKLCFQRVSNNRKIHTINYRNIEVKFSQWSELDSVKYREKR